MHFVEAAVNKLTKDAYDNITQTAEYKVCGAKIEKYKILRKRKRRLRDNPLFSSTFSSKLKW